MKIGYDTTNDEGHAMDAACARPRTVRPFRTVCRLGLAAALLALAGMTGDRPAWGAANWTMGQRAVIAAALKSTVPPELALAVAQVGREQRLRGEGAPGAVGVMQVLPSLAREELGVRAYGLEDTRANAGVGLTLLERLNRRYEGRLGLDVVALSGRAAGEVQGGAGDARRHAEVRGRGDGLVGALPEGCGPAGADGGGPQGAGSPTTRFRRGRTATGGRPRA